MVDFVQLLSTARVPVWVRFPNTSFELKIKKLTTIEIDRCRRQAQKNGRVDLQKLIPAIYKKAIFGIRGLTLEMLQTEFNLEIDSLEKDGIRIGKADAINSDPIEPFWLDLICGIGVVIPPFHYWTMDHTGQNVITDEGQDEEAEKKTS